MNGLTPVRTGRFIAVLIALLGIFILSVQRIVTAVLAMANEAVKLGLARYSNFTGRIAAQNFAEDKHLLRMLHDVQGLLPMADTAIVVLMVVSVLLLVIALLGLALPRQFVHCLVALKLLKWLDVETAEFPRMPMTAAQKKVIAGVVVVVLATVGIAFGIHGCVEETQKLNAESALDKMQEQALFYVQAQKNYFYKKYDIGGAKALNIPDTLSDDNFFYRVTATRFSAELKNTLGTCSAGAKWQVIASTKGFFTKELQLYRALPKDTACAKLTPDFKNLGKLKKQKPAPADSSAKDGKASKT